MVKILCNKQHWEIKDNRLVLDTPDGQEIVKSMVRVLEKEIRNRIYEEICAIDFTTNRAHIVKFGIEKTSLTVQDICAKVALGISRDEQHK